MLAQCGGGKRVRRGDIVRVSVSKFTWCGMSPKGGISLLERAGSVQPLAESKTPTGYNKFSRLTLDRRVTNYVTKLLPDLSEGEVHRGGKRTFVNVRKREHA